MKISSSDVNATILALDRSLNGTSSKTSDKSASTAVTAKAPTESSKIDTYFATKYASPNKSTAPSTAAESSAISTAGTSLKAVTANVAATAPTPPTATKVSGESAKVLTPEEQRKANAREAIASAAAKIRKENPGLEAASIANTDTQSSKFSISPNLSQQVESAASTLEQSKASMFKMSYPNNPPGSFLSLIG